MAKYDESYTNKEQCIKSGFVRTGKGVCKMTALERLYSSGRLDYGSSFVSSEDRFKAGERLTKDYEKGHFGTISSAWNNDKIDCGCGADSCRILTEIRSRYYTAIKTIPFEFWPIVRKVCIENEVPIIDKSYPERKRREMYYVLYCDLCRGLDRLVEFYLHIKIQP